MCSPILSCFNPRVREGRDVKLSAFGCIQIVSIHASVKDATTDRKDLAKFFEFQSTRP